jgi:hypothetical protein
MRAWQFLFERLLVVLVGHVQWLGLQALVLGLRRLVLFERLLLR